MTDVLTGLWSLISQALYACLNFLGGVLGTLFFWLPDDPFADFISQLQYELSTSVTALAWLNWLVDVRFFATVLTFVISAIGVWVGYMLVAHLMDWIKAIKQTLNPGG